MKNLSHSSVLISGANRGMGLGYVRHYLANNRSVIATCRNLGKTDVLMDLKRKHGDRLNYLELDVTNQGSISELRRSLENMGVNLSLVINNAGISKEEEFGKWTIENFEDHFLTNTIGPAMVTQSVIPFTSENSKIIQITSGMGSLQWNINPENGLDAYAASKCALHNITLRLAQKLKSKKIGVYAINPGWAKTEMGGKDATYSIEEVVAKITTTIKNLTWEQTGTLLSEDGISIPW